MSGAQEAVLAPIPAQQSAARAGLWRRFARSGPAVAGAAVLLLVVACVLAAPVLPLSDPDRTDILHRMARPLTPGHWLGTDELGRDLLSRVIWGTRLSLLVGVVAAALSSLIGSALGVLAAYYGRTVDTLVMRGVDMLMAFPYLLLALAIVAALGPSLGHAMLAIIVVNVPFFARAVRGATVSLRQSDFIAAARLMGQSNLRIIATELLPNVLPVVVVTASTSVGWMILETAGLSFLGLGAQPPVADLGGMLGNARNLINVAPHVAAVPALAILLIAIGVNLVGDGVRDALDPRLRAGGLARIRAVTDVAPDRPVPSGPPSDALLSVRALRTEFHADGEVWRAVGDVSFEVRAGEAVGLVGESGSGKTVTALSIAGLVASPPGCIAGGSVRFKGQELIGASLAELQDIRGDRIAYVFQDPLTTLNPLLTVGSQVSETLRRHQGLAPREAMARTVALLEQVGIADAARRARSYPHELSGGQRQRVGAAIALANSPDLIVADEPTTALDVTTQARVLALMNELRHRLGAALVFISHDMGVIAELCDRVHVMYAGSIVESGPVAEVLSRPAHPYTIRLLACVPRPGEARRAVEPILGLPPATNALPPGCAFAPRCDLAVAACSAGPVAMVEVGQEHAARCVRIQAAQDAAA
jgi:peptide/nickel transport system permease protein